MNMFKDMDMGVRDEDILRCYRLGKQTSPRTRPFLVVFTSVSLRNVVMRNRYRLYEEGSRLSHIHINEDLTPARSTLIYRCRQSAKFRSVWTYDGDIFVRPWSRDVKSKGDRLFAESDIGKYPDPQIPDPASSDDHEDDDEEVSQNDD